MSRKYSELQKDFESEFIYIKEFAKKWDMSEKDIEKCIINTFFKKEKNKYFSYYFTEFAYTLTKYTFDITIFMIKIVLACIFAYIFISSHNPTQKFLMKHSQNYMYPIMRTLRMITIPLTKSFKSITDWHEEECLVSNPIYQDPEPDCWPCEDVRTLVDVTGHQNFTEVYCSNEKPFLVKDAQKLNVTLKILTDMFIRHRTELSGGTLLFQSSDPRIETVLDLATIEMDSQLHLIWKIGRVSAARVLRKTFTRPYFVPNTTEVALQRYILINGPQAPPYSLPKTYFANVWLAQGQGSRLIVLDPSPPCQRTCTPISVALGMGDVLYYNWQFWRPRSLPTPKSSEPSITFIGSFY